MTSTSSITASGVRLDYETGEGRFDDLLDEQSVGISARPVEILDARAGVKAERHAARRHPVGDEVCCETRRGACASRVRSGENSAGTKCTSRPWSRSIFRPGRRIRESTSRRAEQHRCERAAGRKKLVSSASRRGWRAPPDSAAGWPVRAARPHVARQQQRGQPPAGCGGRS